MTRSEAIQVIMDTYEQQGLGSQMREKDADSILTALQDAGMLPPDRSHCNCEDCGGPDHSWKSENE